jgi:putative ABC transport system substrate-binding protein
MTRRRGFVWLVAACAVIAPLGTRAQPVVKPQRVALVFPNVPLADMSGPSPVDPVARALVHGLRDLGLAEGRDILIERRSAEGRPERMPVLMQELVELRVDVIVTMGPGARDAQRATNTILLRIT